MPQGLYIMSEEPHAGKSAVMLGLMELLSRSGLKTGFFMPLVRSKEECDPSIELITSHYSLTLPYDCMYGCTLDEARSLIAGNRYDELLALILDRYKAFEAVSDFVLCVGTDFTGATPLPLEFDFNTDVANNLGCLIIPVAKACGRTVQGIVETVITFLESLDKRHCDILSVVVNRVAPDQMNELSAKLASAITQDRPFFIVPEIDRLGRPTVGEIADKLKASLISGDADSLQREVANFVVAAMELPHFLDYLKKGSLIITPGDRSDIILGTLLANASGAYPHIAGLVLTGNLMPAPQVRKLVDGLAQSSVPVLSVETDTFTTAMNANSVESVITSAYPRKIAAALGVMEAHIDFAELGKRLSVTRSARVTPLMFERTLLERARSNRQHIILPEGTEERILRAAEILLLRGVADITFLGNEEEVRQKISSLGLTLRNATIIDPATSELRTTFADTYYELRKQKGISPEMAFDAMSDVSYFGTMMVYQGRADGMVSGSVHTTQHTIRPALEIIKARPGCSIVSSVFFICLEDHVAVFGDCAVNPHPTAQQLADIAISSAETARAFGITPLVAMLSYSTGESGKGEEVDKVREATRIAKELRPDLKIEGPIQYDAAVDAGVARSKMPGSEVAGHATVFVFPDLNTGNNTYKAVQRSANAVAIGPVLQGLKKPVNDLSRGATVTDIVNTVAITAIQAQTKEAAK
jgi:phosphate acetyltransferase